MSIGFWYVLGGFGFCFLVVAIMVATAKEGIEDRDGFHYIEKGHK